MFQSESKLFLSDHLCVNFPTSPTATTAGSNARPTTALKDGIAIGPLIASALTAKVTWIVLLGRSAGMGSALLSVVCKIHKMLEHPFEKR